MWSHLVESQSRTPFAICCFDKRLGIHQNPLLLIDITLMTFVTCGASMSPRVGDVYAKHGFDC
jgi:hypothetical protein